jgi:hypothetical protein
MNKRAGGAILIATALVSGGSATGYAATPVPAPKPEAAEPAIDAGAKDALQRMSKFLAGLPAASAHEDITRELVLNGDLKVQKASTSEVAFRRPDHLRADVIGDDNKNYSIFYDGKMLTLYLPAQRYFAQTEQSGPIGTALDRAETQYGVDFPVSDFFRITSGEDFLQEVSAAGFVGMSRVGGTECEHYAYRTAEVDYQLWIETGDKPLPRKLVITSKKEPTEPQYTAIITWDTSPKADASIFTFKAPADATKIAFGAPAPGNPRKGPAQPKK